ncbi:hypothetical protein [Paracoccus tegillarcae]|uniref:Excalibur calcium-binding domain-containing protein n=1 Tax=Paracoccus tegillarcae TaxID=1529068 RepID=A0A2K9ET87_9RHOB|nr:hypothetical protein [Paracoccus tegillarcae]AUH34046.1 hypothetical protein CUV01_12155 [Paracoccus tegillarcae]
MMHKMVLVGLLALAGCNEHQGGNPNYQMSDSRYGQYLRDREVALMTGSQPPATIPVALPAEAPTAAQIKGPTLMQIIGANYRSQVASAQGGGTDVPTEGLPVVTSGPYPGSTPVLVRYAFAAQHAPGTTVWARQGGSTATAARQCVTHPDAAAAQTAFLSLGGPERDPRGMDPDGDGFVCGWDPAPYRQDQL